MLSPSQIRVFPFSPCCKRVFYKVYDTPPCTSEAACGTAASEVLWAFSLDRSPVLVHPTPPSDGYQTPLHKEVNHWSADKSFPPLAPWQSGLALHISPKKFLLGKPQQTLRDLLFRLRRAHALPRLGSVLLTHFSLARLCRGQSIHVFPRHKLVPSVCRAPTCRLRDTYPVRVFSRSNLRDPSIELVRVCLSQAPGCPARLFQSHSRH